MMPDPESLNAGMGAVGAGGGIGAALTAIYHKWSSSRHMERVYDKISSLEAKLTAHEIKDAATMVTKTEFVDAVHELRDEIRTGEKTMVAILAELQGMRQDIKR